MTVGNQNHSSSAATTGGILDRPKMSFPGFVAHA